MLIDQGMCCGRLLASNSSGAATPATEAGAKPAALCDAITALEERFASRVLFRRFVSAHSARGSRAQEACGLPSFLNATAGHIKCASARLWGSCCPWHCLCHPPAK